MKVQQDSNQPPGYHGNIRCDTSEGTYGDSDIKSYSGAPNLTYSQGYPGSSTTGAARVPLGLDDNVERSGGNQDTSLSPLTTQDFAMTSPRKQVSSPTELMTSPGTSSGEGHLISPLQEYPKGVSPRKRVSSPTKRMTSPSSSEGHVISLEPVIPPEVKIPCDLLKDDLDIADKFLLLEMRLCQSLSSLSFTHPVSHIYNPLQYAWSPHAQFVRKFLRGPIDVLFLGMNPGPYGMAQTGVPFGEVKIVTDWLCIHGDVGRPEREHPKRPILGFNCSRSEVSGTRFWGFFRKLCGQPEVLFRHCFVYNICPLIFMNERGKNLTPPDIRVAERNPLNDLCHRTLCDIVRLLKVKVIIGVGKFAMTQTNKALAEGGISGIRVETILHPSPANPVANKGWEPIVTQQLEQLEIMGYLKEHDMENS